MQHKTILLTAMLALAGIVFFSGQQRSRRPAPPVQQEKQVPLPVREPVEPEIPLLFMGPEDFRFPPRAEGDRSTAPQTIYLIGNPREKGLYVTRTRIPQGKQIVPHTHTDSRTVVVISGTYYYGIGEKFDAKKLVALPPGSFLTEPAHVPHYTWAKDNEVVVQTTAVGPSGTRIVPDIVSDQASQRVNENL